MKGLILLGVLAMSAEAASVHDLTMKSIDGKDVAMKSFAGKVLLIVNVASRCGYTPQYEGLEALHRKFEGRGFAVLGFPANDFLWQEPGSNSEIATFCKTKYGVTFPMFAKISVLGAGKAPLYGYLTAARGGMIKWNFTKFLVGRDGQVIDRFGTSTEPLSNEVIEAVEKALGPAKAPPAPGIAQH